MRQIYALLSAMYDKHAAQRRCAVVRDLSPCHMVADRTLPDTDKDPHTSQTMIHLSYELLNALSCEYN